MSDYGQPIKVLLVEDEERLASTVVRGLTGEGFIVDVAGDGEDGLEKARSGKFDVIVLDIMLPKRNGYLVCRDLRDDGDWTPILMLTAKTGEWDEAEALDTGADDFLRKPFKFVVLVARLKALVRRESSMRSRKLEVGNLTMDPDSGEVFRDTTRINLTSREAALLIALMRKAGGVVSKQELLEDVWGGEFDGDPNVVEVYVGYLRKKIDKPFGTGNLKTIRGSGYMIGEDD